jgi:hypothetical protein
VYDLVGVRWYRRALRRVLWSVDPALLRSQPAARETMIEHTKDAETGHLFILPMAFSEETALPWFETGRECILAMG